MDNKKVVAVFDFDGTITFVDSLVPFIYHTKGFTRTAMGLLRHSKSLIRYLRGNISNKEIKEVLLAYFFAGESMQKMEQYGRNFAHTLLPKITRKKAINKIKEHIRDGNECILISATFDFYLLPWAEQEGFHKVLCTHLKVSPEGSITGHVEDDVCMGETKVQKLMETLGNRNDYFIYAYGDSKGDLQMLSIADKAFYRHF